MLQGWYSAAGMERTEGKGKGDKCREVIEEKKWPGVHKSWDRGDSSPFSMTVTWSMQQRQCRDGFCTSLAVIESQSPDIEHLCRDKVSFLQQRGSFTGLTWELTWDIWYPCAHIWSICCWDKSPNKFGLIHLFFPLLRLQHPGLILYSLFFWVFIPLLPSIMSVQEKYQRQPSISLSHVSISIVFCRVSRSIDIFKHKRDILSSLQNLFFSKKKHQYLKQCL